MKVDYLGPRTVSQAARKSDFSGLSASSHPLFMACVGL